MRCFVGSVEPDQFLRNDGTVVVVIRRVAFIIV
jgi:hypothetical protein